MELKQIYLKVMCVAICCTMPIGLFSRQCPRFVQIPVLLARVLQPRSFNPKGLAGSQHSSRTVVFSPDSFGVNAAVALTTSIELSKRFWIMRGLTCHAPQAQPVP